MPKIAFIGAGNMGGAIIDGMLKSSDFSSDDIIICEKRPSDELKSSGIRIADLKTAVESADYVILAVKPNVLGDVLEEIRLCANYEGKTYMSIAAGKTIESIEAILGKASVVRLMPNICLKSGEGMTVISASERCSDADIKTAEKIFGSCGKTLITKEALIDACTAINGSGPAYVFMFAEAMADGAVKHGIDRKSAYLLAAQTILGSAKLMLESGIAPAVLKDMVCSPGGTTIDAVSALEEWGMKNSVIKAIDACAKKASEMGKK